MKILAFERELPGSTQELFARHAKGEARQAWELYQSGVIRELYFQAEQHTTVLVLECASTHEAADVLASLPYVAQGLIAFELIPLAPYTGFARLFAVG